MAGPSGRVEPSRPLDSGSAAPLGLADALQALDDFPALGESRDRVLAFIDEGAAIENVVAAVEVDVALVAAILRRANRSRERGTHPIGTVRGAVEALDRAGLAALVEDIPTFHFFRRSNASALAPERFCVHAVAVQRLAGRLAAETKAGARDELLVAALLHDVGKPVLELAFPGYPRVGPAGARGGHGGHAPRTRRAGPRGDRPPGRSPRSLPAG
jgi:HD-like signal output (HDOD) protein